MRKYCHDMKQLERLDCVWNSMRWWENIIMINRNSRLYLEFHTSGCLFNKDGVGWIGGGGGGAGGGGGGRGGEGEGIDWMWSNLIWRVNVWIALSYRWWRIWSAFQHGHVTATVPGVSMGTDRSWRHCWASHHVMYVSDLLRSPLILNRGKPSDSQWKSPIYIGILGMLSLLPVCNTFDVINWDYSLIEKRKEKNAVYFSLHLQWHYLLNCEVTAFVFICPSADDNNNATNAAVSSSLVSAIQRR